jgi:hypothetical protein
MDVQSLIRVFKWMGYVALGLSALLAAGLVALILFIWSLT